MLNIIATLHTVGLTMVARASDTLQQKSERGSETIEKVLWAVAVIAIVAIVVGAIRGYVTSKSGEIT